MTSSSPKISICIVTWNNEATLEPLLRSIHTYLPPDLCETFVVDNASSDKTAEIAKSFPWVHFTQNSENRYYAAANNQVFEKARGEFVLILNPDTCFVEDSLTPLVKMLREDPGLGAVTCQLRYPDGRIQKFCRNFPRFSTELFLAAGLDKKYPRDQQTTAYTMDWWDFKGERDVEQPPGACLLVRKDLLDSLGGFDERFPMFFNDVDLCLRIHQAGYRIRYTDNTRIVHHLSGSLKQVYAWSLLQMEKSKKEYFKKHSPLLFEMYSFLQIAPPEAFRESLPDFRNQKTLLIASSFLEQLKRVLSHFDKDAPSILCKPSQKDALKEYSQKWIVTEPRHGLFHPDSIEPETLRRLRSEHWDNVLIPCANVDGFGYANVLCLASSVNTKKILVVNVCDHILEIQGCWQTRFKPRSILALAEMLYRMKK